MNDPIPYDPAAPAMAEARYWRGMYRRMRQSADRQRARQADRIRARRERATLVWALVATVALAVVIAGRVMG